MKRFAALLVMSAPFLGSGAVSTAQSQPLPPNARHLRGYERLLYQVISDRARSIRARIPIQGRLILRVVIAPSGRVIDSIGGHPSFVPELSPLARAIVPIGLTFPPPPLLPGKTRLTVTVPVRFNPA